MRKIKKKKIKKQKKILIISTLLLLLFLCVGYAAFQTNLSITAKGNIVELTGAEMLRKLCNTQSGDSLYEDVYEEERCVYKGSNPNNYIMLNNEMWRIMSIERNNTIKIIKEEVLTNNRFGLTNDWESSEALQILIEYYESFDKESLNIIVAANFYIGPLERSKTLGYAGEKEQEETAIWTGKIGLINPTDYVQASTNDECVSVYSSNVDPHPCKESNYLYIGIDWWTISPSIENDSVWYVGIMGMSTYTSLNDNTNSPQMGNIRPVVYLSPEITLSGTGQENDPYRIN